MIVGPDKVKACKSVLFTEGMPEVKISWIEKDCEQKGDRMSESYERLPYLQ